MDSKQIFFGTMNLIPSTHKSVAEFSWLNQWDWCTPQQEAEKIALIYIVLLIQCLISCSALYCRSVDTKLLYFLLWNLESEKKKRSLPFQNGARVGMREAIHTHKLLILDSLDPSLQKAIVNFLKLLLGKNQLIHLIGGFKDVGKGQQFLCSWNTLLGLCVHL